MIRSSHVGRLLVVASVVLGTAGPARAQEECPLGSTQKSESGQSWCEPSVCDETAPCPAGLVCRPVALCVEIGALDQAPGAKTDGGQRLLARQRCGANKSCPQKTTCSDKGRCITVAQADRAGLSKPSSTTAPAEAPAADAPKKACGCDVPGSSGGALGGGALAMLGLVAIAARRRARAR